METLTVELLGSTQITRGGEGAISFDTDAARALLVYLAAHAARPVPREVLAGLLWPDWPDTGALRNLRMALYRLRNAIRDREAAPPYLLISRDALQLNVDSDISLDVHTFDEHLRWVSRHAPAGTELDPACVERLTAAAELYRGDFIAGYSYPSAEFEEWIVAQRESYHVRMLDVLAQLAAYHEQHGGYRESLSYSRRQVELEPWRESAHRQTMRTLALSGQRATALAQYENCVRILEGELGIEPEAATRDLYAQIRRGELGPPLSLEPASLDKHSPHPTWSAVDQAAISDRSVIARQRPPGPELSRSEAPPRRIEEDSAGSALFSGGERRTVTFLLAEAGGGERPVVGADLEVWAETVHEVLEGARGVVVHYGGTIVQTYDAGFLAAFGADAAHEDDARRAVFAALSIMPAVIADETMDSRQGELHGQALSVGINTGEAIILARAHGGVATHATVIDQLRDIREQILPGTVWVTEATYQHIAEQFAWTRLGEVADAKRDTMVRLYSPVAAAPTVAEHTVGGLRVPLVGRGVELDGAGQRDSSPPGRHRRGRDGRGRSRHRQVTSHNRSEI